MYSYILSWFSLIFIFIYRKSSKNFKKKSVHIYVYWQQSDLIHIFLTKIHIVYFPTVGKEPVGPMRVENFLINTTFLLRKPMHISGKKTPNERVQTMLWIRIFKRAWIQSLYSDRIQSLCKTSNFNMDQNWKWSKKVTEKYQLYLNISCPRSDPDPFFLKGRI